MCRTMSRPRHTAEYLVVVSILLLVTGCRTSGGSKKLHVQRSERLADVRETRDYDVGLFLSKPIEWSPSLPTMGPIPTRTLAPFKSAEEGCILLRHLLGSSPTETISPLAARSVRIVAQRSTQCRAVRLLYSIAMSWSHLPFSGDQVPNLGLLSDREFERSCVLELRRGLGWIDRSAPRSESSR